MLAGASEGDLLVDMSTIHPTVSVAIAQAAAERGVAALDAPVSGGDVGAQQGTLSIMVGGAAADFERARPLFEVLGKTIVHVGEAGAGQVVKACNQVVVAVTIAAVSEALVLGSKAGVRSRADPRRPRRRTGRQQGHGDAPAQLPRARLHAGLPDRPAPQGPQHRARVG